MQAPLLLTWRTFHELRLELTKPRGIIERRWEEIARASGDELDEGVSLIGRAFCQNLAPAIAVGHRFPCGATQPTCSCKGSGYWSDRLGPWQARGRGKQEARNQK